MTTNEIIKIAVLMLVISFVLTLLITAAKGKVAPPAPSSTKKKRRAVKMVTIPEEYDNATTMVQIRQRRIVGEPEEVEEEDTTLVNLDVLDVTSPLQLEEEHEVHSMEDEVVDLTQSFSTVAKEESAKTVSEYDGFLEFLKQEDGKAEWTIEGNKPAPAPSLSPNKGGLSHKAESQKPRTMEPCTQEHFAQEPLAQEPCVTEEYQPEEPIPEEAGVCNRLQELGRRIFHHEEVQVQLATRKQELVVDYRSDGVQKITITEDGCAELRPYFVYVNGVRKEWDQRFELHCNSKDVIEVDFGVRFYVPEGYRVVISPVPGLNEKFALSFPALQFSIDSNSIPSDLILEMGALEGAYFSKCGVLFTFVVEEVGE